MAHIEKTAIINRDPASVWSFLTVRKNAPQIVPNLRRVWDITPEEAGVGQRWKFEFDLFGIKIEGEAQIVAFEAGRSYAFQTSNSVESRWTYTVEPEGTKCRVTVAVDYQLPDSIWGRIKDKLAVSRIHESQVNDILANLEAKLG